MDSEQQLERARHLLQQEGDVVLRGLRDLRRRYRRINRTLATLDEERQALMLRGRAAGVPVVEMAQAAGTSRQSAHNIIREAQEQRQKKDAWDARRRRKGVRRS